MSTDVIMPQMGESIFEGTITKWLKKAGDAVEKDEPLFEISTDKVDAEIPSPVAGVLTEIRIEEGATVQVNTVVAVIDGATASAATTAGQSIEPPVQPPPHKPNQNPSDVQVDVVMPQMGESIFEGTITKWLKKVGDAVQKDEPLFEISTDKVDAEIPSPLSGILTEIRVPEGATVEVNTVVAIIGDCINAARRPQPKVRNTRRPNVRPPQLPAALSRGLPHRRRPYSAGGPHPLVAARPPHRQRARHRSQPASPAPATKAASPKTMCCAPARVRLPPKAAHPRVCRTAGAGSPSPANSYRSRACAPSSPSAWSRASASARTSIPSTKST